ncbi:amidohydrolase [Actinoalloteichus sp. AHMU CJ021]|uniref:Protein Atu4866 n=1 Tax=Actinoalloteichus caeruleus DSM 43889 TaxID=1120930 RepID=A0ABT1JDK1_ACTCY|nr:Atu4866 domain-containing protein [Actinoalloteichus caeruleus]AUS81072.1 amidohydrolase [Actinoalloteichus sp. AHMU CJ021]MCP2330565.1 protein Atu4866 [Actinoalloteichus caeruleus DSM 43889]
MTSTPNTWTAADLDAVLTGTGRPVLITDATILTSDPVIGTLTRADLLVGGDLVVGVGPGIVRAADDDGAIVIQATGTTLVPSVLDTTAPIGLVDRAALVGALVPGGAADFAVLDDADAPDLASAARTLLAAPERTRAVFRRGVPVAWDGHRIGPGGDDAGSGLAEAPVDPARVGVWIDTEDFLHQELTAEGRYDETRGGRTHAFEGRYWVRGDRIDYLDDLGFWAFGEFDGDTLHHAGYTLRRKPAEGGTDR